MKMNFNSAKFFIVMIAIAIATDANSKDRKGDCTDCMGAKSKIIEGQPNNTAINNLVALAEAADSREVSQLHFCAQFAMIEWQLIASLVKEMEATPYPIDSYFQTAACQPGGYSDAVKSPILHTLADDPSKREKFLDILWLYYTKKRNDPAKFVEAINAKNTEGETLLDYFESQIKNGRLGEGSQQSAKKIIAIACSHGAVYSAYPNKKCP
jgi:hypothetical protein